MLGHARQSAGTAGEGLFQYLAAFHWQAEVVQHGNAQGTDAHLAWPDLDNVLELPVQVKSTGHPISLRAKHKTLYLEPSAIRGWAARKPIIAICDLVGARAWWFDTDGADLPFAPKGRTPFRVPLINRVDGTTCNQIRLVALRRWYRSMDYPSLPRHLRNVRPDRFQGFIEDAYVQISQKDGHDRDVIALATTRFLQMSRQRGFASLDSLIEPMIDRARSTQQGGRSHSLTALLALLLPLDRTGLRTDLASDLSHIAEFAVTSHDFVHSEFGLLLAAKLAESGGAQETEHFYDLLGRARAMKKTRRFHAAAQRLAEWQPRAQPLTKALGARKIAMDLTRPSDISMDVFNRQDEALDAVARAIALGADNVSAEELRLIDHWTRYRADQFLEHHFGRAF